MDRSIPDSIDPLIDRSTPYSIDRPLTRSTPYSIDRSRSCEDADANGKGKDTASAGVGAKAQEIATLLGMVTTHKVRLGGLQAEKHGWMDPFKSRVKESLEGLTSSSTWLTDQIQGKSDSV